MLIPGPIRIPLVVLLIAASTLVHVLPLLSVSLLKALLPQRAQRPCTRALLVIAEGWIAFNSALFDVFTRTRVHVEGAESLDPGASYLVLSNHQSWVDIPVLQKALNRRIPLLRFFLKSQLFWVPLLGLAWWALDFPFMRRHSKAQIERRPELLGRDLETTRRACARFGDIPVSVMNFVEGTRFIADKHSLQRSPYRHLLLPKAGGIAFVLDAMDGALSRLLDVTLIYPQGRPTLYDLLADRVPAVQVIVRERPIPTELRGGDYAGDPEFRARFQSWVNELWREKDALISERTKSSPG